MPTANSADLLKRRSIEVNAYIAFLQAALERNAAVQAPSLPAPSPLDIELTHTLKANTYLLLYNVVEATMTQLLVDIHNCIKLSGAGLDELVPQLYLHILERFRQNQNNLTEGSIPAPVASSMISHWLIDYDKRANRNANYLLAGNVDSQRIREIGHKYGFASQAQGADAHLAHHSLLTTKSRRNELAHGERSFTDCGRDVVYSTLQSDATELLSCLGRVVAHVDNYLRLQLFLRANAAPPPVPAQLLPPA